MQKFARMLVLLLTLGVLYSGPVAACVCLGEPMPAMPCCPDQPQDNHHSDWAGPISLAAACEPAPASLLPAGSLELPAPSAISSAAPPAWQTHAPPEAMAPNVPEPHNDLPIYLVTLRLRN